MTFTNSFTVNISFSWPVPEFTISALTIESGADDGTSLPLVTALLGNATVGFVLLTVNVSAPLKSGFVRVTLPTTYYHFGAAAEYTYGTARRLLLCLALRCSVRPCPLLSVLTSAVLIAASLTVYPKAVVTSSAGVHEAFTNRTSFGVLATFPANCYVLGVTASDFVVTTTPNTVTASKSSLTATSSGNIWQITLTVDTPESVVNVSVVFTAAVSMSIRVQTSAAFMLQYGESCRRPPRLSFVSSLSLRSALLSHAHARRTHVTEERCSTRHCSQLRRYCLSPAVSKFGVLSLELAS